MNTGPTTSRARVLHVGAASSPSSDVPRAQLAWASFSVEHCDDVYHALARLGANGRQTLAVVVCVDDLDAREMEFFRVAAQYHSGTPVYVYGRSQHEARLVRALELGARGRFGPGVISSIQAMVEVGPGPVVVARPPGGVVAGEAAPAVVPVVEPVAVEVAEAAEAESLDAEAAAFEEPLVADELELSELDDEGGEGEIPLAPEPVDEIVQEVEAEEELLEPLPLAEPEAEVAAEGPAEASALPEALSAPADEPVEEAGGRPVRISPTGDVVQRVRLIPPVAPPEDLDFVEELEPVTEEGDWDVGLEEIGQPPAEGPDAPRGPARVPWLRYADTPVRQPPPRRIPPPARTPPPVSPPSAEDVGAVEEPEVVRERPSSSRKDDAEEYEPLLSLEELEALIGEDEEPQDPERAEGGRP